jgi:hypothetical protein
VEHPTKSCQLSLPQWAENWAANRGCDFEEQGMKILEDFGKLLAFSSFVVLALAVTHEWAFFYIIGRQYQPLMTAYDYLTTTLSWLPASIAIMLFVAFGQPPQNYGKFIHNIHAWQIHMLGVTSIMNALMAFLFNRGVFTPPSSYLLVVVYIFSVASNRYIKRLEVIGSGTERFLVFYTIVFILLMAYGGGLSDAYTALRAKEPIFTLSIKGQVRSAIVLRNIEKGVIARSPESSRIEYFKCVDIDVFASDASLPTQSDACRLLGIFCNIDPKAPLVGAVSKRL